MADKQEIPIAAEMWVIKFDDADVPDEVFFGENAEKCAREVFKLRNYSWNCHLFGPAERISSLAHQLSQEKDWKRLNRVFKSTSDKTIDQDMQIERLESENARLTEALRGPQAAADEKCGRFLIRAEKAEAECEWLKQALADIQEIADRETANEEAIVDEIVKCSMNALAVPELRKTHWLDEDALLAARRTQEREEHGE